MIVRGHMPGNEFWRVLAVAALVGLLVEILLTRWIAIQRKSGSAAVVRFGLSVPEVSRHGPPAGRRIGKKGNEVPEPVSELSETI